MYSQLARVGSIILYRYKTQGNLNNMAFFLSQNKHIALVKPYLRAVQNNNNKAVNEALNDLLIEVLWIDVVLIAML